MQKTNIFSPGILWRRYGPGHIPISLAQLFSDISMVAIQLTPSCPRPLGGNSNLYWAMPHTVPKVIDFPRYNMKCSGDNVILRGIVHVVSGFPLHFMFYRGNLDCFSNWASVQNVTLRCHWHSIESNSGQDQPY